MKRFLITGASGFVGHHLIKACQEAGYFVVGIDKRPIPEGHAMPNRFILDDVSNIGFRDLINVDYVGHLAWRTNIPDCQRHPIESTRENIDMSIHLLEYCREAKVKKFLFPSTASLYGHNPTPWKEDMVSDAIEPYSWQKLAIEEACKMYSKSYGLPTVLFRFFQVFGEFSRDDNAIAVFQRLKDEGKPVQLVQTEPGRTGERDFIYAGDIARALVMAAESDKTGHGELYNVAGGSYNTIKEIADTMGVQTVWAPPRDYEVPRHHADVSKIKETLGWKPKVEVIKWLNDNIK